MSIPITDNAHRTVAGALIRASEAKTTEEVAIAMAVCSTTANTLGNDSKAPIANFAKGFVAP